MARAEGQADAAAPPVIDVEVVYAAAAHVVDLRALRLPAGATVADALRTSGVLQRHGLVPEALAVGVWGRACSLAQGLCAGDRVEIYRPLRVDPKAARRLRAQARSERPRTAGGTRRR